MSLGGGEVDRVGALEAEDRLLVVAHGEQRPPPGREHAAAGEELLRERSHDCPLVGVGVLRLVDQDMRGRLVELEAHPVADTFLLEQRDHGADQVVEVDRPHAPLCAGVGAGIVAPDLQRIGEQVGIVAAED